MTALLRDDNGAVVGIDWLRNQGLYMDPWDDGDPFDFADDASADSVW